MEEITLWVKALNGLVWGPPMLILILGVGFFLMVGLRLVPLAKLGFGFRMLWRGRVKQGEGDIPPYQALMTVLPATVGTGNIAGVATAIFLGGPGALFWMWCTALVGMATKYAEAVLAMHYREVDGKGSHLGGPMYYIKLGLGKKWLWMATAFALFGVLAGFGIGNRVQANSVAHAAQGAFGVPLWVTGVTIRIGSVSSDPVAQGTVAMIGTFIDTLVICTITGLVILVSGVWDCGEIGAALSSKTFETALPGVGAYIVAIGLVLFAYTTILGWSVYGERCAEYLFGERIILPFRVLWVVGAMAQLDSSGWWRTPSTRSWRFPTWSRWCS